MVKENIAVFERHAQTALVMLLVALLVWVGKTVQDTAIAVGRMQVEVSQLQAQIAKPDSKFKEIELRLQTIEKQLNLMTNHTHPSLN